MGERVFRKFSVVVFTLIFAIVICGAASAANADIQVNQTVNNSAPNYGDNVKFTDTVSNNGPNNATGVQVTDKLPGGLIYESDDSNGAYDPNTGIWTIGNVTYGTAPKTLNIIAKVNATGTIKNVATKTAETETDPNLNNNAQQTVLKVPKAVDINVNQYSWYPTGTYTCSNTPVFVVDVRNNGNDDATNVVVSYKIGNGYEYIGTNTRGVGTATYNSTTRTITWIIPYMPAGAESTPGGIAFMNVYLRAIATGTQTQDLTNTATLTSVDQYDTNNANNQKSLAITVPTSADIQVNQTVTGTPSYNKNVTITITATNNGPNNSTGVTIKDLLPSGLQYISYTASQGTYDPTTGIWTIGNFTYGTSPLTLTIIAKITATTGIIKNTAFLTGPLSPAFTDWNYDNNAQTTAIVLSGIYTPSTNVSVTQYSWYPTGTYTCSNTPVFVVDVRNNGNDDATNVVVSYKIGNGYEYIGTNTRGVGTATYNSTTRTITWIIPYMPAGAESTPGGIAFMNVYLRAIATGTQTQDLTNTATLVSPVYTTQPTKSLPITVPTSADIQVKQTVTGTPNYNNNVTIKITATNNGPNNSTGVTIKDLLPSGLQYISYTAIQGTYDPTTGIWTIGNFTYGTSPLTLTIIAKVNTTGTIKNVAVLTAPLSPAFTDWNYDNNAQQCIIEVPDAADIQVNQTASSTTPTWKSNIVLSITVKNNGPNTANNVQVTSLLPIGLKYLSATPSQGTYDPTTGIWNIGTILSGQNVTLTITVNVLGAGLINNTANKTGETEYDWNATNNQQTVNLNVPVPSTKADIQVTQTTNKTSYNIGDTVTITVTVKNNGSSRATGVQITDILPNGLTYSSSTATAGSYSSSTGIWNIGTMRIGNTQTLTITAIATALGNITNTAFKSAENQYDQNLNNDAQSVTVNVANRVTHFTDQGTATGTVDTDDGTTSAITLPFNVTLYGQTYNTMYINVNGLVSFGAPVTGPYFNPLPPTNIAYVAPFWSDIDVTYAGNINYNISANQVTITWSNVPGYTQGSDPTLFNTISLIITSDGKFAFVYGDMQWKNDPSDYVSYARISNGNGTTKNFWTSAQSLSAIANSTIWFDSNGNVITG